MPVAPNTRWRHAIDKTITTTSSVERGVLATVVIGWVVVLVSTLGHRIFVSHDSLSNNAHVWYISEQIWHGHGLPFHMPMLAKGHALAYPYAFIPWTSAALLRPLLGDFVVTLWLVGGFIAMVTMMFRALPELRRGWIAAAALVNPALVMSLLVGQIPFIWAMAMLFSAIHALRRHRRWLAAVLAGLAMATHPAVVGPITVMLFVGWLWSHRDRRALLAPFVVALAIAVPAAVMVALSPAFEQTSTVFRVTQFVRVVATRSTVVGVPLVLIALRDAARHWYLPAAFALLAALSPVGLGAMNRYAWAAPWRSPDEGIMALIHSDTFVANATYRVLGFSDGRMSMYRLIRHGARLDSEFFPESQARRSFHGLGAYEAFLADRRVDYVVAWTSYDRRWGTDEHALLRELAARSVCPVDGRTARLVMSQPGFEVYAIRPC